MAWLLLWARLDSDDILNIQGAHMKSKLETIRKNIQDHRGWKWFLLFTVLMGATMSALDVSIVNVAMPTLKNTFRVSMAVIEWVAMAYMLTLTIFLPLFGRLADMFGRSRLYTIGFLVFSAGSLFCGMSQTAGFMITARIIQAVGAGLLQANSVALITHAFPGNERGKAIGIQAAVQAIAMSIGPFVGGILIATIGWQAIFYVNIPIGIAGTLAALFVLPFNRRADKKEKVDYIGAALFATGLACVVLAFNDGIQLEGSSPTIVFLMHASILLCLFILTELRVENPLIDLKLFQNRTFLIGNLTGMLSYFVLFAVMFLMPFYLEKVMGYSVALTGALLTPLLLAMAVVAPFSGHIADKYGPRIITTSGMLLSALACFALMLMGVSVQVPLLAAVLILLGVGMGMFITPNNSAVIGSAPQEKLGVAGGVHNMMRSLGLIFGVNISGLIFTSLEHRYLSENGYPNIQGVFGNTSIPLPLKAAAFMHGFMMVIMILMAIAILSAFLSSVRKVKTAALVDHEAAETALVSSGFFNGFSRGSRGMALFLMLLLFAGVTGAFASARLDGGSFSASKAVKVLPGAQGSRSGGQGQRTGMRDWAFDLLSIVN